MSSGSEDHQYSNAEKEILQTKVTGKVKWYNVKKGYGFIHRDDNDEDIFVHQSAILKWPTGKQKSLGEDEDVVFDVVQGSKGNEAMNVTGPKGEPVAGSNYVTNNQPYNRSYRENSDSNRYENFRPRGNRGGARGASRGRGNFRSDEPGANGDYRENFQGSRGGSRGGYDNGYRDSNRDESNYAPRGRGQRSRRPYQSRGA